MNQDVYRVAFDSAKSELDEILQTFEQLRTRKERIEKVVAALMPILGLEEDSTGAGQSADHQSGDHNREGLEQGPMPEEEAVEVSSDPFQRRIDLALGVGNGSRKFSRQFHDGQLRGK